MGRPDFIWLYDKDIFYMILSIGPKSIDLYLSTEVEFHLENIVSNKQLEDE
jgi:hypothetical protein